MEPQLHYSRQWERWEGEDPDQWLFLWMKNETYHKHYNAYCEQQGITDPRSPEARAAHQHCRRLSFWQDCPDPEVHIIYFGQRAIEQARRQAEREQNQ